MERSRILSFLLLGVAALMITLLICCGDNHHGGSRVPDGCQRSDGEAVDGILFETCLAFHERYLFPDQLPLTLDGITTSEGYVVRLLEHDPFVAYYSAETYLELLQPLLEGERAYVGVVLAVANGEEWIGETSPLLVEDVLPYTRAWYDGVQVGDRVLGVREEMDSPVQSVDGLRLDEARAMFPRHEGEEKVLVVDREGTILNIPTAAEEHIGILLDGDLAYLSVRRFTTVTGSRVEEDLEALRTLAGGALGGVILDLRGNPGGSVGGALALADYLIYRENEQSESFPILTYRDRDGVEEARYLGDYAASNAASLTPTTCVILMDGSSASASEIVIAALRDYEIATLLGSDTYGKGIRQILRILSDGSAVAIPSDYILPPNGESYHRLSISPDVRIEPELIEPGNDPVLETAKDGIDRGSFRATPFVRLENFRSGQGQGAFYDPALSGHKLLN